MDESSLLLDLADRDRYSPTYGCFFYPYWRSKSSDFVNVRCQEAAYTLALLYRNDYPGNHLSGLLQCGETARAGLLFWVNCQHRDGSFDEWYRGEHGFAATAFSAFALSRAYRLLEDEFSDEERGLLLEAFSRAARWLGRHDDLSKINHEAVGAAALFSLAEVLKDEHLTVEAREKVEKIIGRQTGEGWFPELGGLDTGYSFLTLEYLAQCYLFQPDPELRASLTRALDFLVHFVHPDITTGREYNLCGNSYVSLLGAAIMGRFSPPAARLFREGVCRSNVLTQLAQDDLSRCYHLYNGLLAYDRWREHPESFRDDLPLLPYASLPFRRYFPEASILAVRTETYYALVSGARGGLLKLYPYPQSNPDNDLGYHDQGYTIVTSLGENMHSCRLALDNRVDNRPDGGLEVTASFRSGVYFFPHPSARFLLRLISAVPGGYLLIKKGVDFIRRRKQSSLQLSAVSGEASPWILKRLLRFEKDTVVIRDEIMTGEDDASRRVNEDFEIRAGAHVITRPSPAFGKDILSRLGGSGPAVIKKTVRPGSGGIDFAGSVEASPHREPVVERVSSTRKKSPLLRGAQFLILAAICFFLGKNLYHNWHKLISYSWDPDIPLLILSLFVMVVCGLLVAIGWNYILRIMGQRVPHLKILRIYFVSELGKYLPGKIWTIVGRVILTKQAGVPRVMTLASIGIMLSIMVVSGVLITILSLPVWPNLQKVGDSWYFVLLVPLGLIGLHPRLFGPALNWVLNKFEHIKLKVRLKYRDILLIVLYWGVLWIVKGVGAYILLRAVYHEPLPAYAWISLTGVVALTWVAGTFSFFPAGLGIMEAGIAILLQSLFGIDLYLGTAIAIFIRVWGVLAELACIGLTFRLK